MNSQISLKEACDFILDGTHGSPERMNEGIPVLSAQNVAGGKLSFATDRFTTKSEYQAFSRRLAIRQGDVLLTIVGTIGRAAVVDELKPLVFQRSVAVLRPKNSLLDSRFLFHITQSIGFRDQIRKATNQSSQAGVYLGKLEKVKIPLPPIAEQKRIAAILDKADELRGLRRRALEQLDAIAQSTFLEMFGDPVTNPKEWKRICFSDLLAAIESGRSPNCLDRPIEGEEWGVLKLGAVTWCEYNSSENKALPPNEKPDLSLEVKVGDLLFTRKNTFELVAACALVRATPPRLLLPDLIFRFRTKADAPINLCFLHQLLINPAKRREIQKLASGSASSMPNISKGKLEAVLIEVPPLHLQQEFARRIEAIEQLKATHRESLAQLDALFATLQHRAFRGEL